MSDARDLPRFYQEALDRLAAMTRECDAALQRYAVQGELVAALETARSLEDDARRRERQERDEACAEVARLQRGLRSLAVLVPGPVAQLIIVMVTKGDKDAVEALRKALERDGKG